MGEVDGKPVGVAVTVEMFALAERQFVERQVAALRSRLANAVQSAVVIFRSVKLCSSSKV